MVETSTLSLNGHSQPLTLAFETDSEADLQRGRVGWPHLKPGSVFIAAIGSMWQPGCYPAVKAMVECHRELGFACWLEEIQDSKTQEPYAEIRPMRDYGIRKAQAAGFEWVCLVDCDVKPVPDTLSRLIRHDVPIIAPLTLWSNGERAVGEPHTVRPNTGLQPMVWVPLSFLLIRVTVLNCLGLTLFSDSILEGYVFQRLWHFGHRPIVDTDMVLDARDPGMLASLPFDLRWQRMRQADVERRRIPNRS